MKHKVQNSAASGKESLVIRQAAGAPLSRTQVEFNRLMKNLETTKASHAREQTRLDAVLATSIGELMPQLEELNRVNHKLVVHAHQAMQTLKLSVRRRLGLADLISGKAAELLQDPVGLSQEEIEGLSEIVAQLGPSSQDLRMQEQDQQEFNFLRMMMEQAARHAGLKLDLSDLAPNTTREDLERLVHERLGSAAARLTQAPTKAPRKLTKTQAEKVRKRLEQEEAKNRDLKSLFKQLAKAFHPDLEPEPRLKESKKVWMQRLNAAYAVEDLREMLQLEMEWLGEEASNLTTAGDEKLQVYCMVLKEQIAELKKQTHQLLDQAQYGPLQRFRDSYCGTLANPLTLKRKFGKELTRLREMLQVLAANNPASRQMLYAWVDEHIHDESLLF